MGKLIVLCPNPYRDRGLVLAERACAALKKAGFEVAMSPVFVDVPENSKMVPLHESAKNAAMVVSFGGDGTFLHVAREVMGRDVPLLGLNLGAKGFMAGLEPEDVELVVSAAGGKYRRSVRMLLDVELLRDGECVYHDRALNDAVVKSDVSCIGLRVESQKVSITSFSGDGVIIATPTGSTAYSMSAGGPIVEPEAANIIVTPICAHVMAAKSFVLSPDRELIVIPERLRGRRAVLCVDGCDGIEMESGDEVRIRRSGDVLLVADPELRSFYDTAYDKLTHSI